jgi:Mor family transcriptional regulator
MQYHNAAEILPRRLLREIQAYAGGKLLYVPIHDTKKNQWGSRSGAKLRYHERNAEIRARRQNGESCQVLAEHFGLTEDSIRKIVRQREPQTVRTDP